MELKKIKDYNPYLRGIISNLGFEQIGLDYHRNDRKLGKHQQAYTHYLITV